MFDVRCVMCFDVICDVKMCDDKMMCDVMCGVF
jgi:hypothetical protein